MALVERDSAADVYDSSEVFYFSYQSNGSQFCIMWRRRKLIVLILELRMEKEGCD